MNSAKDFASSVFPTPVGPRNKKVPIGRFGSFKPDLARLMASDTVSTASSCPTRRLCKTSSMCKSLSISDSTSFVTGIPVHLETTSSISDASTSSFKSLFSTFSLFS